MSVSSSLREENVTCPIVSAKVIACKKVLPFIKNDMILGLGTGSTAEIFLDLLSDHIRHHNIKITATTTSIRTRLKAEELGMSLIPQNQVTRTDLCIDGTDEFDNNFHMIKGGGGALLCEKIIAQSADKMLGITDESKFSKDFGRFPLPIEINPFETGITFAQLKTTHAKHAQSEFKVNVRKTKSGDVFKTDMGHLIVDLVFEKIEDPNNLYIDLLKIAGVVEHGLFLNEADIILTNARELHRER